MRYASIDIGTNTILMLVAEKQQDNSLKILTDEHHIARLGKGVDENGIISEDTFLRVHNILSDLKLVAEKHNVDKIFACGTSALRDAKNKQQFIDYIKTKLDIEISIISGEQEAKLTYLGTIHEHITNNKHDFAVLDIGGGSTELVAGDDKYITNIASIDIGSVRITERFLKTNPPNKTNFDNAINYIQENIFALPKINPNTELIGVAGTLTTLACLDLNLKEFDKTLVNKHVLTINTIENILNKLKHYTLDEIKNIPTMHPSRADIILAGIIILHEVLLFLGCKKITVSDKGLRYGILIKAISEN